MIMRLGLTQTGMNLYQYKIFAAVYLKPGRKYLVPGFGMK